MKLMKAAITTRYGPPEVVRIEEVPKPKAEGEATLVQVTASAVNSGDARIRAMRVPAGMGWMVRLGFGIFKPRNPILGTDFIGTVESVGEGSLHSIGETVIGSLGTRMGTHAEYVAVPKTGVLVSPPENLGPAESVSLIFGGVTALHFLAEKADLKSGEHLLINGATGSVGVAAIQIAKHLGAEVTAICSGTNADLARSLGADHVIDYATTDFSTESTEYDVIMDNVGTAPWSRSKRALKEGGRLVLVAASLPSMLAGALRPKRRSRHIIVGVAQASASYIQNLVSLAEVGLIVPVVEQSFPLDEIVDAHRLVDSGRKRGSVIINVNSGGGS